jgi:hypothetical protein
VVAGLLIGLGLSRCDVPHESDDVGTGEIFHPPSPEQRDDVALDPALAKIEALEPAVIKRMRVRPRL